MHNTSLSLDKSRVNSLSSSIRSCIGLRARRQWVVNSSSPSSSLSKTFTAFDELNVNADVIKSILSSKGAVHDDGDVTANAWIIHRFSNLLAGPWKQRVCFATSVSSLIVGWLCGQFAAPILTGIVTIICAYTFFRPVVIEYVEIKYIRAAEKEMSTAAAVVALSSQAAHTPSLQSPQPPLLPGRYFERVSVRLDGSTIHTGQWKVNTFVLIEAFVGCGIEWTLLAQVTNHMTTGANKSILFFDAARVHMPQLAAHYRTAMGLT